jgi:signal transduction histidine kinase
MPLAITLMLLMRRKVPPGRVLSGPDRGEAPVQGQIILGLRIDKDFARLWVRDSGPGIDDEGKQKLFQIFSQVDSSDQREFEGTGLGLALVRELVEKMGGEVGVSSQESGGGRKYPRRWNRFR